MTDQPDEPPVLNYASQPPSRFAGSAWRYVLCVELLAWLGIAAFPPFQEIMTSGSSAVPRTTLVGRSFIALRPPPTRPNTFVAIDGMQYGCELFVAGAAVGVFTFILWTVGRSVTVTVRDHS